MWEVISVRLRVRLMVDVAVRVWVGLRVGLGVRVRVTVEGRVTTQQVGCDARRNERRQDVERQHVHVSTQRQPESTKQIVPMSLKLL